MSFPPHGPLSARSAHALILLLDTAVFTKGYATGPQMVWLLGKAAVTKPRAGPWEPAILVCRGLWVPVDHGGRPSGSSCPGSSRLSSRMGREQHTISRVKFYLLNAQCAQARNKTKPFQDAFQIPDTHWAAKRALLPLIFISHRLGL